MSTAWERGRYEGCRLGVGGTRGVVRRCKEGWLGSIGRRYVCGRYEGSRRYKGCSLEGGGMKGEGRRGVGRSRELRGVVGAK